EPLEVLERAELLVHRRVPARRGADRPRTSGIVGGRGKRVVLPLAVCLADRVDRRQVHDVEAELGKLREHGAHAVEATPAPREELVPGAEASELAIDVDLVRIRPRLPRALAGVGRERVLDGELLAGEQDSALGELAGEILLSALDLAPQLVLEGGD